MDKEKSAELEKQQDAPKDQEQLALDDARRVKVLSPGMLVFKRFIRNKLAVVGIIIIAVMFIFSFLGPIFSPYGKAQIFTRNVEEPGKYATGKFNTEPRILGDDSMKSAYLKALGDQKDKTTGKYNLTVGQEISFTSKDSAYILRVLNPNGASPSCGIYGMQLIATSMDGVAAFESGVSVDEGLKGLITEHAANGGKEKTLEYKGMQITVQSVSKVQKKYFASSDTPVALASVNICTPTLGAVADFQSDTEFLRAVSLAVMAGESSVDYKGDSYALTASGEGTLLTGPDGTELFNIELENRSETIKVESTDKDGNPVTEEVDFLSTVEDADAFLQAMDGAISEGVDSFTVGENTYTLEKMDTEYHVTAPDGQLGVVVANSFTPVGTKYDALDTDLEFRFALETAIGKGAPSFSYNGENFGLVNNGADYSVTNPKGEEIMLVSDIAYGPDYVGIELTVDFVKKLQEAMRTNQDSFVFVNQYGEETTAQINIVNGNYYVSTLQKTTLIDGRAAPSSEHPLGTDVNGMDVLTRLMYGGQVSLIVGFVVVFFELFLGVIVGGISGYFGGVVDTILMRLVELFNAIPFYPMLIIIGSVMDNMRVGQYERLMMTMVLLGVLGWTGIARLVRGQILSLREQDFMVAAEATGIRTSRRIFRHLIPNVMPLLIVNATASLGSIILTEATLGYLGLGVKYPMASWGSIVTQVNDMQVMKTAWWIWIPAGLCVLITVLGFNFAGDGLRDAFDPKMKR